MGGRGSQRRVRYLPEFQAARITETRTVPLKAGQVYGWRLSLDTAKTTVHFREEFELPLPPQTWGYPEGQRISGDRKTSVLEGDAAAVRGYIGNRWAVAPGDPCGKYTIRVFIEEKLVATFEFDVECEAV